MHRGVQWKKEYRTFLFAALAAGSVPVDAEKSKHLPLSVTEKAAQVHAGRPHLDDAYCAFIAETLGGETRRRKE